MMISPTSARGSQGGSTRFIDTVTPPRGSNSSIWRRSSPCVSRCFIRSNIVLPGGGSTPPTMTRPISPSACAPTTVTVFAHRMAVLPLCRLPPGLAGELARTEIAQHRHRRVEPGRAVDVAAGVRAGAAEIEALHRRAMPAGADERPAPQHLVGHQVAMEDLPAGHAVAPLDIDRQPDLAGEHRRPEGRP